MRTRIIPLALSALLASCAHHAPAPNVAPPGTARTPEDVDGLFGERFNAGDLDGLVTLYEAGATLVRSNGSPATGQAAIRSELAGILAVKPQLTMNVKLVRRGGENVAVLYNDWHGSYTDRDGSTKPLRGCAVEVVRRQADGRWLFVVDDPDGRHCGSR